MNVNVQFYIDRAMEVLTSPIGGIVIIVLVVVMILVVRSTPGNQR